MNNNFLTLQEIFTLIFLTLTLLLPLNLFNKKIKLSFANPLIFYSLIMIYYCVITPIYRIFNGITFDRGLDFREQMILGWQGALLSSFSVILGYLLVSKVKKKTSYVCPLDYKILFRYGLLLNLLGLTLYMLAKGFDLSLFNPFNLDSYSIDFLAIGGGLKNYIGYAFNFLIPGNFLMFASSFSTKKNYPLTTLSLILSILLFLTSGFRYRIFLLLISLIFYILIKSRFKISNSFIFSLISIGLSLIIMQVIGILRDYSVGLNLSRLSELNNLFNSSLVTSETSIFLTSSGIVNIIPEKLPFQNLYPIFKTIIHPLPSAFFDKNSGDYLFKILFAVYDNTLAYKGSAYLYFAEYYLMFGWFGIFFFSIILGSILKRLWIWINIHKEEPIAIIVYILNLSYIFMIITRGYLPQQFHLYMFSIFPINLIYFWNAKSNKTLIPK